LLQLNVLCFLLWSAKFFRCCSLQMLVIYFLFIQWETSLRQDASITLTSGHFCPSECFSLQLRPHWRIMLPWWLLCPLQAKQIRLQAEPNAQQWLLGLRVAWLHHPHESSDWWRLWEGRAESEKWGRNLSCSTSVQWVRRVRIPRSLWLLQEGDNSPRLMQVTTQFQFCAQSKLNNTLSITESQSLSPTVTCRQIQLRSKI